MKTAVVAGRAPAASSLARFATSPYVIVGAAALVTAFLTLHLWSADWRVLFNYDAGSDAITGAIGSKAMFDLGWIGYDPYLATPLGVDFSQSPQLSFLHVLALRLALFVTHDWALATNVYYVATYPLAALTSYFVLQRLGAGGPLAAAASVLFAFLPDHILRSEVHLVYAAYYLVPLTIAMVIVIARGDALWARGARARFAPTAMGWFVIGCALATAWDNEYHALFALVMLAAAAFIGAVRTRTARPVATAAVAAAVILAGLAAEIAPTLAYNAAHPGRNTVQQRRISEAETYALRMTELVLPIAGHRVEPLAAARGRYDTETNSSPIVASLPALGFFGTIGFVLLLLRLVVPSERASSEPLLHDLAAFNLVAFLLGTIGGLGALVALFVTPQFRAYDRISPFIACLSLFALAIALDAVLRRYVAAGAISAVRRVAALVIVVAGVLDQVPGSVYAQTEEARALSASDAALVAAVATRVPAGAKIFEVPYVPFPESAPVNALAPYAQLRPYLHSSGLRWSVGASRSTAYDDFVRSVDARSGDALATVLQHDGFAGILVFRSGFADGGKAIESQIARVTRDAPLVSRDGLLAFYALPAAPAPPLSEPALRSEIEAAGRSAQPAPAADVHPAAQSTIAAAAPEHDGDVAFANGFSPEESSTEHRWHWATAPHATVSVHNGARAARRATLTWLSSALSPEEVTASAANTQSKANVGGGFTKMSLEITLRPGDNEVTFATNGGGTSSAGDPRRLYFSVLDFTVTLR